MYPIEQSPLYRLSTKRKLADLVKAHPHELTDLCHDTHRHYRFFSLRQGSKLRPISTPIDAMKKLHGRLFSLLQRIETPDYLHSGVPGRSYVTNARVHIGHRQVFKVDLKNFFPSVSPKRIHDLFLNVFQCAPDISWMLSEMCLTRQHLPTGSSISQVIAFMSYRCMFDEIFALAQQHGLHMSCYVDDLTFSGEHITKQIQYDVKCVIRKHLLTPHKFRFYGHTDSKLITGVVVSGTNISVRNKHQLIIHEQLTLYQGMVPGKQRDELWRKLLGRLHAAGIVDPTYREKAKHLTRANIDNFRKPTITKTPRATARGSQADHPVCHQGSLG
ncbi:MAG TPA: reverse transcriptase family protein [Kiritimatiellia bacterium]|nr:reverse transcriptase family protein [Kiritimatiellia bacterium]HMO97878.1 reverse transcriptase family protein [Kiritimatiellia bacterium]HMP95602.1 reverse transcriptase family protein [Kiritimatiellia bacterium]